jgi:DnaK suppressor protein
MNPSDLNRFRQTLLGLKAELEQFEAAAGESAGTVELDQSRVGRLSRMDALQAQQMALETSRRRQQRLVRVEGALRRVESGDYGDCFKCGEAIDLRRLEADPTQTRCIKCAEA